MEERSRHPYYPRDNPDMTVYWDGVRRGELLYQVCNACAEVIFHPRVLCPYCLSDALRYERSAGHGNVYSFTIQHYATSPAWRWKKTRTPSG